ncbi:hypothetical protein BCD67_12465 [Oscillatoriales cyanobacterium USR001]|nr:hypothetical protein BCD67_12465 [Oscillatoriales cyanobacterium USR001]
MEKSPEEFIKDMDAALDRGDFYAAQRISIEAGQLYPEHSDVQKYAYILAPAKVTVKPSDPEQRKNMQASREWIRQNLPTYRHRWIALRSGELVADAASLDELADRLDDTIGLYITVLH